MKLLSAKFLHGPNKGFYCLSRSPTCHYFISSELCLRGLLAEILVDGMTAELMRFRKGSALAEKSKSTELQLPQTCLWTVGARNGGTVGRVTRKDPFEVGC
jgi:hypothetical protein